MLVDQLAQQLGLEFSGNAQQSITSVASFKSATSTDLCFLQSNSYIEKLNKSRCSTVIVPKGFDQSLSRSITFIYSKNPHLSFVEAIYLLKPELKKEQIKDQIIHPSAQIAETAVLGENVIVNANVVIGENVKIANGVRIGPACVIQDNVEIGEDTQLISNVTLCHTISIGNRVILHPGVVIGSDGFGLVYNEGDWEKIPHLGSVKIGDRVEIGANTTVDRGALDDTVIENGVKLDNLIQVAHNVRIGENTAIAACVGIAGSAIIGKNCRISGAAVILGHLSVADNVTVTAMSLVTKSIKQSGTYSSGTPLMENHIWHRNNVRYKSLDKLAVKVMQLEKNSEK